MYFDQKYFKDSTVLIATDEVGRGPLAGPVVSCAVKIDFEKISKEDFLKILKFLKKLQVTDSKKLSEKKRELILEQLNIEYNHLSPNQTEKIHICGHKISFNLCEVNHKTIDQINILQASLLSMKNAVESVSNAKLTNVLIDGNKKFNTNLKNFNLIPIIKGDTKSLFIGLASIIAKVYRDSLMKKLDLIYPGYGLKDNAGYPSVFHKSMIAKLGPCEIHRKTFKGVKEHVNFREKT